MSCNTVAVAPAMCRVGCYACVWEGKEKAKIHQPWTKSPHTVYCGCVPWPDVQEFFFSRFSTDWLVLLRLSCFARWRIWSCPPFYSPLPKRPWLSWFEAHLCPGDERLKHLLDPPTVNLIKKAAAAVSVWGYKRHNWLNKSFFFF